LTLRVFYLLLLCQTCQAGELARYSVAVGFFANEGDYRSQASDPITRMQFVPVTVKLKRGDWTARLQTAWIKISGPGNLGEGVALATDQNTSSGPGDTTLGVDWQRVHGHWVLETGFRLKLPTADEDKALGTGSRDQSLQFGLSGAFSEWRPFSQIGYKRRGQSPLIELESGPFANLGLDRVLTNRVSIGAGLDWRRASVAGNPDPRELFAYGNWIIDRQWRAMLYAGKGLSDGAADKTAGMQFSYSW